MILRKSYFFTTVKDKFVCLICGETVATAKRHNVERHSITGHNSFQANYPPGSALRAEEACESSSPSYDPVPLK